MHRFILSVAGAFPTELTQADLVHQLGRVLKLRAGERVVLCDGAGREAVADLVEIGKKKITVSIVEERPAAPEPPCRVTLYLALIKPDAFDDAIGKAVQAGAARIVPVLAERSVKRPLRRDRLEKIIREAAEQSGRGWLPVLDDIRTWREALEDNERPSVMFMCVPGASAILVPVGTGLKPVRANADIGVCIGPEGGWTQGEESLAMEMGCIPAGLGATILRAETAATVATYLAANLA